MHTDAGYQPHKYPNAFVRSFFRTTYVLCTAIVSKKAVDNGRKESHLEH